jgi:hypothetical protein
MREVAGNRQERFPRKTQRFATRTVVTAVLAVMMAGIPEKGHDNQMMNSSATTAVDAYIPAEWNGYTCPML